MFFTAKIGTGSQIQVTPGVVSNVGKQVGVQNVATNGTFNNVGSQIGVQMGRKKRAAQFNGFGGFGTMNMNGKF